MERELKELYKFRRSGASITEVWKKILSESKLQKLIEQNHPEGKLAVFIGSFLLSGKKNSSKKLQHWESKHPSEDIILINWWKFLLEKEQKSLIKLLKKIKPKDNFQNPGSVQALSILEKESKTFSKQIKQFFDTIFQEESNHFFVNQNLSYFLTSIGKACLPPLMERYQQSKNYTEYKVINLLGNIGQGIKEVPSFFVQDLLESENNDCYASKAILTLIGKPAVPQLIEHLLQRIEKRDTKKIIEVLDAMDEEALKDKIPELVAFINKTKETDCGAKAIRILGKIRADTPIALELFTKVLNKKSSGYKKDVCWALGRIGSCGRIAIPELVEALSNEKTQGSAACTLGLIGKKTDPIIQEKGLPKLKELAKKKGDVAVFAEWAYLKLVQN